MLVRPLVCSASEMPRNKNRNRVFIQPKESKSSEWMLFRQLSPLGYMSKWHQIRSEQSKHVDSFIIRVSFFGINQSLVCSPMNHHRSSASHLLNQSPRGHRTQLIHVSLIMLCLPRDAIFHDWLLMLMNELCRWWCRRINTNYILVIRWEAQSCSYVRIS